MLSNSTCIVAILCLESVQKAINTFEGAYGLGVISPKYPDTIIATRKGSPLVIGIE